MPSVAHNPFADAPVASLGAQAFNSALNSANAGPADPATVAWRPYRHARSSSFLSPGVPGLPYAALAKSGILQEAADFEAEAIHIQKELDHSERLITEAWEGIRRAPLIVAPIGKPRLSRSEQLEDQRTFGTRLVELGESVVVYEWYFFVVVVIAVIAVDLLILQHMPEIERTHLGLLSFWMLVASAFCAEVWLRQGQKHAIAWATGYILEIIFSIRNIFIFNVVFHTLETPRRLMRKALMVTLMGSILLRFAFVLGLGDFIANIALLPFLLGALLICCGTQQVSAGGRCEEGADVTQTPIVCALRWCLGARFGVFYDEEKEAVFVSGKNGICVTLLGAAIACLCTTDLLFSSDAILVKLSLIPNAYVCLSSSVIALFTLRALFFVVRDILSHLSLARYCTGLILLFTGAEMLVAQFTEVSALMSLVVVVNVIMLMATFSAVRDSACPKRVM